MTQRVKRYRVYEQVQYGMSDSSRAWEEINVEYSYESGELYLTLDDAKNAALEKYDDDFGLSEEYSTEWKEHTDQYLGDGWICVIEETETMEPASYFINEVEV